MLQAFIAIVLAGSALAQTVTSLPPARPSPDDQLANVGQLLERGRTADAERLFRQLVPKPEEEPVQDPGIFTHAGFHDVLWGMIGYYYLGANNYADAERVTGERLRAAEARGAAGAGHVPIFLSLMAEIYRLQGKHTAAFPLYTRMYQLWIDSQMPAEFQTRTEMGYVECLIVRGDAVTAEMVSQPAVDPDGSYVGPSFHESTFNTHAVAMEEAGHQPAAAIDPKESLQIRTVALAGYSHFLSVRGRSQEAQTIQSQLTAMGCRFAMCE